MKELEMNNIFDPVTLTFDLQGRHLNVWIFYLTAMSYDLKATDYFCRFINIGEWRAFYYNALSVVIIKAQAEILK